MACFLVPGAEAVVVTLVTKAMDKKNYQMEDADSSHQVSDRINEGKHTPIRQKMKWLSNMLWGGSALLAFEHIWHGEITPFFPFLTAAQTRESLVEMLHEMSTVGVTMMVLVTAAWGCLVGVSSILEARSASVSQDNSEDAV